MVGTFGLDVVATSAAGRLGTSGIFSAGFFTDPTVFLRSAVLVETVDLIEVWEDGLLRLDATDAIDASEVFLARNGFGLLTARFVFPLTFPALEFTSVPVLRVEIPEVIETVRVRGKGGTSSSEWADLKVLEATEVRELGLEVVDITETRGVTPPVLEALEIFRPLVAAVPLVTPGDVGDLVVAVALAPLRIVEVVDFTELTLAAILFGRADAGLS